MSQAFSDRRLTENELLFRALNERVKAAITRNFGSETGDMDIGFYCECANVTCRDTIEMSAPAFRTAHSNPRHFIIKKGHENSRIERVVGHYDNYDIVEKYDLPPANVYPLA